MGGPPRGAETFGPAMMKSWSDRLARRPTGRPRSPASTPWFIWRRACIISMRSMRSKLYRDVNIDGTLHLARCAADAGVKQFIFVSTVLVHGRSNDGRAPFSENDILTPRGLYGMSKAAAEAGLRNIARESEMRITVIRPPLVYGSGAKGNFALLKKAVRRGIPLPFAGIDNHRAFLSVQNLSSFISQRLRRRTRVSTSFWSRTRNRSRRRNSSASGCCGRCEVAAVFDADTGAGRAARDDRPSGGA